MGLRKYNSVEEAEAKAFLEEQEYDFASTSGMNPNQFLYCDNCLAKCWGNTFAIKNSSKQPSVLVIVVTDPTSLGVRLKKYTSALRCRYISALRCPCFPDGAETESNHDVYTELQSNPSDKSTLDSKMSVNTQQRQFFVLDAGKGTTRLLTFLFDHNPANNTYKRLRSVVRIEANCLYDLHDQEFDDEAKFDKDISEARAIADAIRDASGETGQSSTWGLCSLM